MIQRESDFCDTKIVQFSSYSRIKVGVNKIQLLPIENILTTER